MNHFSDKQGYNSIHSQADWLFRAARPRARHRKVGAYFTTLDPGTKNLAMRIRVSRDKIEYLFQFSGQDGLKPIPGDRGAYILYTPSDYTVVKRRQHYHGKTKGAP